MLTTAAASAVTVGFVAIPQARAEHTTPHPEIMLAIDTTGSMGGTITQAQEDARRLVQKMRAIYPETEVGVIDFRDSDDPSTEYIVRQNLTSDAAAVEAAINGMTASGGGDYPEGFNLLFNKSYTDTNISWERAGRHVLVVMSDAEPHGVRNAGFTSCTDTSTDPYGLNTATELANMRANKRTLVMVRQASAYPSLDCYRQMADAAYTGGTAIEAGTDLYAALLPALLDSIDSGRPIAAALPSAGRRGTAINVRYRTRDNLGDTREVITIRRGIRTVKTISVPMHHATWSTIRTARWMTTQRTPLGAYRFCVTPFDRAGNKGVTRCSSLTVRR